MKICTIIGARPQFIKAAPVSLAFSRLGIDEILVHTGQHYDTNMSDIFFSELGIPAPLYNLGINGGLHGEMTGKMLAAIEQTLISEVPDALLVYGDTNSTLAGALASAKVHIPIAHVEAGLRSFNNRMPEEINRIITDRISDLLFTPTEIATANLVREGTAPSKIHQVGDVMYDAAILFGNSKIQQSSIINSLELEQNNYILATIHRAENTDHSTRITNILTALNTIGTEYKVILPIHPRTLKIIEQIPDHKSLLGHITIIDPVGYLDMTHLEKHAALIVTDSGGIQKEAFFHKVPCVTLRDETEWSELVESGWNTLVPPINSEIIIESIRSSISKTGQDIAPYGIGSASDSITKILSLHF